MIKQKRKKKYLAPKKEAGFTIIEVLMTVTIIALIGAYSSPFLINFMQRNDLETTVDKVIGTIRKAQNYAANRKDGETWGVCLSGGEIVLFSGSCASPTFTETFEVPGSVTIEGLNETTFSADRGEPSAPMTITISTSLDSRTVYVNAIGRVAFTEEAGSPPEEPPELPPDWWSEDWSSRRKVYFDNSGQSEILSNFPVLVVINSGNFNYGEAKGDGTDLRFIDSDAATELTYHIEEWNASGNSYVWVKVPQIDGSSSTDHIFMYWGNVSAPDVQDIAGTYDSSFVAVYHLNEEQAGTGSPDIYQDSAGSGHHGDDYISATGQEGKIGKGHDFDGVDDYARIADHTNFRLDNFTLEAWAKLPDPLPTFYRTIVEHDRSDVNWWGLWKDDDGDRFHFRWSTGSVRRTDFNTTISPNTWYYVVGVLNKSALTAHTYLNGQLDKTVPNVDLPTLSGSIVTIGATNSSSEDFDGLIDEVRISSTPRSSDWIKAQYLSMNNTFLTFVDE